MWPRRSSLERALVRNLGQMTTMPTHSEGAKRYFRLLPIITAATLRSFRGHPWSFSFNVTDRCPIGCNCYWRAQDRVKEMDDDAVVAFFYQMRTRGFVHATLVGGEPYVNPRLLECITPIMPTNWLVTSGTTPLRWFPKTTHMISIDGKDAETHNKVRQSAGLFERIEKHLAKARNEWVGEFPAIAHCVLNALNFRQIGDILEYWSRNKLLDGILFSTATPIRGANDNHLRLTQESREWIVQELMLQKKRFGRFMCNTESMIGELHPLRTRTQTPETCGTAKLTQSFNAAGERIGQCILSEKADCSECGCVITAFYKSLITQSHDPATFGLMLRLTTV
jgi:organic radical activating enzyme